MDLSSLFSHYKFLQPEWLWLIFPVLLFLSLRPQLIKKGWLTRQNQQAPVTTVKHPLALNDLTLQSNIKKTNSVLLTLACSSLVLLAFAQPVRLGMRTPSAPTSADMMLIIDTSISMVLRDYKLNGEPVDRMTMTQALLDRFSRRFSGKRIGIVILGDPPQVLLRPSEDKNLVRHLIYRLRPTVAGRQAALGDALAIAAEYIKSDKLTAETVLVLISDAVRPAGKLSPIAGAERAAQAGATLHTIAIGSTRSQENDAPNNTAGGLIYAAADTALLQQMAQLTGGESFHAVDVNAMDEALKHIEQRHQKQADENFSPQTHQALFSWPLLAAIFLLMIKELLPYRQTKATAS